MSAGRGSTGLPQPRLSAYDRVGPPMIPPTLTPLVEWDSVRPSLDEDSYVLTGTRRDIGHMASVKLTGLAMYAYGSWPRMLEEAVFDVAWRLCPENPRFA